MNVEILIKQLGGMGRLRAMIGAHSFVAGEKELHFQFKGSAKANRVVIKLENDVYGVAFYAGRGVKIRKVAEVEGVYADALRRVFEAESGLYLSI